MRGTKLFLCLFSILLLSTRSCNGLCNLENGTMARCRCLQDAKYIDTYDLEMLKTTVSEARLQGEIFHKLVSLQHLDLSRGEVEQIDSDAFRELLDLRNLDLSYNKITALPSKLFHGLKKLHYLNLRGNSLVEIPDAVLSVKSLKTLDLIGNPLNCNCATLKARDVLLARKVHLSKKILCAGPRNLRNRPLLDVGVHVICKFEEQDKEMQMDQPEGSGEPNPVDHSDNPVPKEIDEEKEVSEEVPVSSVTEEIETPAPQESVQLEGSKSSTESSAITSSSSSSVTNNPPEASSTSGELFFTEDRDRLVLTSTIASTTSTEVIEEKPEEPKDNILPRVADGEKDEAHLVEGSGEDELHEGSGTEGSGTGVPPISWDVPEDEVTQETSSPEPEKTTDGGLLDMIWGVLWSTPSAAEDEKKKDLDPEDEEFINVSSEATPVVPEKTTVHEDIIVPSVVKGTEGSVIKNEGTPQPQAGAVEVKNILDDAKSGKVRADDSPDAEATDASATRQPKKGMGSYVVLAALLAVLAVLIGFAAYKGDFCRKKRKRNDPESGTELKDMRKSLLDAGNGNQPKIPSNGNLENVPLVSTPPEDDSRPKDNKNEPISHSPDVSRTRYSGMPPDVVDPIKPPRKSYAPHDETEGVIQNGRSQQDLTKSSVPVSDVNEPVRLRNKSANEPATNGNNHHDSISSLGTESRDSPSIRTSPRILSPTNGSLGTLQDLARPPLSPGAQRVKITLTENPDSVPKTPILITRTKMGENLVKTP